MDVDLESGIGVIYVHKEGTPDHNLSEKPTKTNPTKSVEDSLVKLDINVNEGSLENNVKENRKKGSSAKKPPRPPRPPRGFSLDAYDQKLIKELAELAMLKRARIERMKALKQKKNSKSSSSSSSHGSLFAMIFTIMFFLVVLFQGMSCQNSNVTFQGSPQTAQTNQSDLIFIQEQLNPSASDSVSPSFESSNLPEKVSG